MTRSLRYVAFDQLHDRYGALREALPGEDVVVMVESNAMLSSRQWHQERLFFYRSAARHFARQLEERGFVVHFEEAASTLAGLRHLRSRHPGVPLVCAEQSTFRQRQRLATVADIVVPNDFFLTPATVFDEWASEQKTYVMESFYRAQRLRLGVLVTDGRPDGERWNYDKDNRLGPPKNYTWVAPLEHELDDIDRSVAASMSYAPSGSWATTREGAQAQLEHFLRHHFAAFGPYEDAMTGESWSMHHSLLSPYLNVGLLHPSEVLAAALARYLHGDVPISSAEGFVRQLIGWREYVNALYWHFGPDYQSRNELDADGELLPLFDDASATSMTCVADTVRALDSRAWVHHIPRLMILSNLALITGTAPQAFLAWMRRRFIDAAEWVMVPNVIGMGLHADGGQMMTKPYAAGGAYISRMSTYCGDCPYNPKLRTGATACPFTTLYWDFLDRHEPQLRDNHRMAQQLASLRRLSDLAEVRERAAFVRSGLRAGQI